MFFEMVLERDVQLHPRFLVANYREALFSTLANQVEGTYSDGHGLVVMVKYIESVGTGLIPPGTGYTTFRVRYCALLFRAFKGEILEAVVKFVNNVGFFAEAGPATIFVSKHMMPVGMVYQTEGIPNYSSADGSIRIIKETEVRVKIIGTRVENDEIHCVATIKGDSLGVI